MNQLLNQIIAELQKIEPRTKADTRMKENLLEQTKNLLTAENLEFYNRYASMTYKPTVLSA